MYDLELLKLHLETYWGKCASRKLRILDPHHKLPSSFEVLEFSPSEAHDFWIYATLGMSIDMDDNLLELHAFSKNQNRRLVELLTVTASFHRNDTTLGLHHTVNIGQPWQKGSKCDHAFISLPYLDGSAFEIFKFGEAHLHNLWLLPITESERNFKIAHGWDALEERFEECELDYLNPYRNSCA